MDEDTRKLLEEEIKAEIRDISSLETGSKEKSAAIKDLAELYKLRIDETKTELEYNDKYERRNDEADGRERDDQLKKDQLEEQVRDRYFRLGVETAGIILPLIFYAVWMRRGFRFEETGTYTSATFRGLFGRFKPTRK